MCVCFVQIEINGTLCAMADDVRAAFIIDNASSDWNGNRKITPLIFNTLFSRKIHRKLIYFPNICHAIHIEHPSKAMTKINCSIFVRWKTVSVGQTLYCRHCKHTTLALFHASRVTEQQTHTQEPKLYSCCISYQPKLFVYLHEWKFDSIDRKRSQTER